METVDAQIATTPGALVPSSGVINNDTGYLMKFAASGALQMQLAVSPANGSAGATASFCLNLSGGQAELAGPWSWCDGSQCTALGSYVSNGTMVTGATLPIGNHALSGHYGGDGINPAVVSPVVNYTVIGPAITAGSPVSTTSLVVSSASVALKQTLTMLQVTVSSSGFAQTGCGGLTRQW